MHLLSIKTGKPHPAAAEPWIDVECERATELPVQIFREKVVWQRCKSDPQAERDIEVWNWQSCELVWVSTLFRNECSLQELTWSHASDTHFVRSYHTCSSTITT